MAEVADGPAAAAAAGRHSWYSCETSARKSSKNSTKEDYLREQLEMQQQQQQKQVVQQEWGSGWEEVRSGPHTNIVGSQEVPSRNALVRPPDPKPHHGSNDTNLYNAVIPEADSV